MAQMSQMTHLGFSVRVYPDFIPSTMLEKASFLMAREDVFESSWVAGCTPQKISPSPTLEIGGIFYMKWWPR